MTAGCPEWPYDKVTGAEQHLAQVLAEILAEVDKGNDQIGRCCESRGIHSRLFKKLAPRNFEYYAGNYRGSRYHCLQTRDVRIGKYFGLDPKRVARGVAELASRIRKGVEVLDAAANGTTDVPKMERLQLTIEVVRFACDVFVLMQRIHPYLNGNGHIGRYIVVALLKRYRLDIPAWRGNNRPAQPYDQYIEQHRNGVRVPLESYVHGLIAEAASPALASL